MINLESLVLNYTTQFKMLGVEELTQIVYFRLKRQHIVNTCYWANSQVFFINLKLKLLQNVFEFLVEFIYHLHNLIRWHCFFRFFIFNSCSIRSILIHNRCLNLTLFFDNILIRLNNWDCWPEYSNWQYNRINTFRIDIVWQIRVFKFLFLHLSFLNRNSWFIIRLSLTKNYNTLQLGFKFLDAQNLIFN